jgi:hypothetical protein
VDPLEVERRRQQARIDRETARLKREEREKKSPSGDFPPKVKQPEPPPESRNGPSSHEGPSIPDASPNGKE